jgi:hypothetical protein
MNTRYGVTRTELERQTKLLYAEVATADPYRVEEITEHVTGGDVFVWHRLSVRQLTAMRRALYVVVMGARG